MASEEGSAWERLPESVQIALDTGWSLGVPGQASAVHARWWQLETWLRSLCYVELCAKYGPRWIEKVPAKAMDSARKEAALAYMTSSDSELVLSYLDVFDLFDVFERDWDIFSYALLDKQIWQGRTKELRQIRHRSAHCRRPHSDDLIRIEQTLRDLEKGAFRALSSFNVKELPEVSLNDPVVESWVREGNSSARGLIGHAESHYDVSFRLVYSRRPWAPSYRELAQISGQPGYLWHAVFTLHRSGYDLVRFWNDFYVDRPTTRGPVVFVCADSPFHLDVSFSALSDPVYIAAAIGDCFDAILSASRRGWEGDKSHSDSDAWEDNYRRWTERSARLSPRVQARTPWATVDETTVPISIFAA